MVYLNVRHTVADYGTWRPVFDADEARRRTAGATGVKQVYRDVDDPNTITVLLEWDNAENARKFAEDPALRETMQKAGVIGMPAVRAMLSPA
jgi:heme-degrading monooxygenase HmoA